MARGATAPTLLADGASRAPENDPEVPEMNEAATQPTQRSVQLAVLRTPTSSLLEAVAEARRRPDSVEFRNRREASTGLVAAAA
jgi:hypothetical protein